MSTRQSRKTNIGFKLPTNITKKNVIKAYSTSKNIIIEGYTGDIQYVDSIKHIKEVLPCRPVSKHGGKAWVRVKLLQ